MVLDMTLNCMLQPSYDIACNYLLLKEQNDFNILGVKWDPSQARLAVATGTNKLYMWSAAGTLSVEVPVEGQYLKQVRADEGERKMFYCLLILQSFYLSKQNILTECTVFLGDRVMTGWLIVRIMFQVGWGFYFFDLIMFWLSFSDQYRGSVCFFKSPERHETSSIGN